MMAVNPDREKALGDFKDKVVYHSMILFFILWVADLSGSKAPGTQGMGCETEESPDGAQESAEGVQPYRGQY